jgi:uncharacterized membrane protein
VRAETAHQLIFLGVLVGLAFALFAGYETLNPAAEGVCSVNAYVSCSKIDTSGQTTTLGIADWLWGVGGFLVMLAIDIPLIRTWKRSWLEMLTVVSLAGALMSIYLGYLELFVIQGLCIVCLGAYLSNVVVIANALYLVRLGQRERADAASAPAASA